MFGKRPVAGPRDLLECQSFLENNGRRRRSWDLRTFPVARASSLVRYKSLARCLALISCRVSPDTRNPRFQFQKRSQLLIRTHNETLAVVAMCVNNPDRSPL